MLALVLVSLVCSPFTTALLQASNLTQSSEAAARAEEVKVVFREAYAVYKAHAWGHDSVNPISGTASDDRNGWGATIIDSMSAMKIMGLDDLYDEALAFVGIVDFTRTTNKVSVFETTIRYIGGLLSAYELDGRRDAILLQQAQVIGDKLAFAWQPGHDIPTGSVNYIADGSVIARGNDALLAEGGTLLLEFATLSKYTGNDTYRALAEKTMRHFIRQKGYILPGLPPQNWDVPTGQPKGTAVTWGGGSDSYMEYLAKAGMLLQDNEYTQAWKTAVDTSIAVLAQHFTVDNHLWLADYNEGRLSSVSSHLAGFAGGNWMLGGAWLGNETVLNLGRELVDSAFAVRSADFARSGPR